jgi:hypothetical protein
MASRAGQPSPWIETFDFTLGFGVSMESLIFSFGEKRSSSTLDAPRSCKGRSLGHVLQRFERGLRMLQRSHHKDKIFLDGGCGDRNAFFSERGYAGLPKSFKTLSVNVAHPNLCQHRGEYIPFLAVVLGLLCRHQSSRGTKVGMLQELLSVVGECGGSDGLALSRTNTQILPPRSRSTLRLWEVFVPGGFSNIPSLNPRTSGDEARRSSRTLPSQHRARTWFAGSFVLIGRFRAKFESSSGMPN